MGSRQNPTEPSFNAIFFEIFKVSVNHRQTLIVQGFEDIPIYGRGVCKKTIQFKSKALFFF
ncbi:hypothetical protein CF386_07705 [Paraphotobacterium marinum]|uniref:Uncharacterized protein n=1 Tax=Paraphotobacterium marinum TaxID=1755811 RepID=A0A220VF03_9GAMM|nr:hypothetical protein CF386_07705 [Paraphotobacterium marinum]